jgi:hypothetical protein
MQATQEKHVKKVMMTALPASSIARHVFARSSASSRMYDDRGRGLAVTPDRPDHPKHVAGPTA